MRLFLPDRSSASTPPLKVSAGGRQSQMNDGESNEPAVACSSLVMSRGDALVLLEPVHQALDAVALMISLQSRRQTRRSFRL
jgi:hypothetical protein